MNTRKTWRRLWVCALACALCLALWPAETGLAADPLYGAQYMGGVVSGFTKKCTSVVMHATFDVEFFTEEGKTFKDYTIPFSYNVKCVLSDSQGYYKAQIHVCSLDMQSYGNQSYAKVAFQINATFPGLTPDHAYHWFAGTEANMGASAGVSTTAHAWQSKANETEHWTQCDICDAQKDAHSLRVFDLGEDGHVYTCAEDGCAYTSGTLAHTDQYEHDQQNHWQQCAACGHMKANSTEAHYGSTYFTSATHHQLFCARCAVTLDEVAHTWGYGHNATYHYECCSVCSQSRYTPSRLEAHAGGAATCVAKAVCATCACEYGSYAAHDWQATGYGFTGKPATCLAQAICGVCGNSYGELAAHTYTAWQSKGNGAHVEKCAVCQTTRDQLWLCTCGVPTCTQAGSACMQCGYAPPALTHNYTGAAWISLANQAEHYRDCLRPGCADGRETQACSGGVATCAARARCALCGGEYGTVNPDHHALVRHAAKAATCAKGGWKAYETCANCAYTTYSPVPARSHYYGLWESDGANAHTALCLREGCGCEYTVACAFYTAQVNGESVCVCPVCGACAEAAFAPIPGAHIEAEGAAYRRGEFIARGAQAPAEGVLYAFTAACEYAGQVEPFLGRVQIALPVALAQPFSLARAEETGALTPLPYSYENGVLTFETEAGGLYLLLAPR